MVLATVLTRFDAIRTRVPGKRSIRSAYEPTPVFFDALRAKQGTRVRRPNLNRRICFVVFKDNRIVDEKTENKTIIYKYKITTIHTHRLRKEDLKH